MRSCRYRVDAIEQRAQFALNQILESDSEEIPDISDDEIGGLLFSPLDKAHDADKQRKRIPEYEPAILTNPTAARYYASYVIQGPWPEAEPIIATSAAESYTYAKEALDGERFPAGEPAVLRSLCSVWPINYAEKIIKGRWPEYEQVLLEKGESYDCYHYCRELNTPVPELEPVIARDKVSSYLYATHVLNARFLAGEPAIQRYPDEYWDRYKVRFNINEQVESLQQSGVIRVTAESGDVFENFTGTLQSASVNEAIVKNAAGVQFKVKLGQCTPVNEDNTLPPEPDPVPEDPIDSLDDEEIPELMKPWRQFGDTWIGHALREVEDEMSLEDIEVDEDKLLDDPEGVDVFELEANGNEEYRIYKSEDVATKKAIDSALSDLRHNPEIFNADFLINYVDKERLKNDMREIASDVEDIRQDSDQEVVDYLIKEGILEQDDFYTEEGDFKEPDENDELRHKMEDGLDTLGERRYARFDPIEWYKDVYGKREYMAEILKNTRINEREAAEAAVSSDGFAHYLYSYNNDYTYLPCGAIVIRTS